MSIDDDGDKVKRENLWRERERKTPLQDLFLYLSSSSFLIDTLYTP